MEYCYRVEVNSRSKYFKDFDKAVSCFCDEIKKLKSCEFWIVHFEYSSLIKMYTGKQVLVDYYSPPKFDYSSFTKYKR